MQITEAFKGKTLVITGGTGSFGSTVLKNRCLTPTWATQRQLKCFT